ncbi:MAG: BTAD domain-containing putative transcriptional regulator [Myxococcota bacterium]
MSDPEPDSEETLRDDLVDAFSRGRLSLSELAVLRPAELDALFELACERLDTDRNSEAASVLRAVVTLFPYDARYWRGLGIALHRQGLLRAAYVAYDGALALDRNDPWTRCYRGEVALQLGERSSAERDLYWVEKHGERSARLRAAQLLSQPKIGPNAVVTRTEPPIPNAGFTLEDHTPLPLNDGRFAGPSPMREEETLTAVAALWVDATSPGVTTSAADRGDGTESTAQIRRPDGSERLEALHDGDTGKIRRTAVRLDGDGDTARVFRGPRSRRPDGDTDVLDRRRLVSSEVSDDTAVTRRRSGLPIPIEEEIA